MSNKTSIEQVTSAYTEAAGEYLSALRQLNNSSKELEALIAARDSLKEHPDFTGQLPQTYFSGGELDPQGVAEGFDRPRN